METKTRKVRSGYARLVLAGLALAGATLPVTVVAGPHPLFQGGPVDWNDSWAAATESAGKQGRLIFIEVGRER